MGEAATWVLTESLGVAVIGLDVPTQRFLIAAHDALEAGQLDGSKWPASMLGLAYFYWSERLVRRLEQRKEHMS